MAKTIDPSPNRKYLTAADIARLGDPLDLIKEDHFRLRHVCALLDAVSGLPSKEPGDIDEARQFLSEELAFHIADEETDLFPMLRARCALEDDVGPILDKLMTEHSEVMNSAAACLEILDRQSATENTMQKEDVDVLRGFAAEKRRHLIVENAILIPLAHARLNRKDLLEMLTHMLQRRGFGRLLEEASQC